MLSDTHQAFLRVSRARDATEALSLREFRQAGDDAWAFAYAAARLAGGVVRSSGSADGLEDHCWAVGLPFQRAAFYDYRRKAMVTLAAMPAAKPSYQWKLDWVKSLAAMPENWPLWGQILAEAEKAEAEEKAAPAPVSTPDHTYDLGDWLEY